MSIIRVITVLCMLINLVHAKPPNVVVFLTDDQGWGDLSLHGNKNLSTPNIDSLAREGVQFENFYVCQVCAPTRAEFLTGRYHLRTGVSGVTKGHGRLNADEVTVADAFKAAGYKTACFGKWHNGTQPPYHPNFRGFDEFYGFTSGHWGHYFSPPLDHNGQRVKGEGFIVDDFTNHALEFIEQNKAEPFFCYIPYNTPHSPMYVKDENYKKFTNADIKMRSRDASKEDLDMTRAALALCENIDDNVGRILKKLENLNLKDDTIVLFFSDNGPNSYRWNGSMKGKKGSIDEGGIRSPLFMRWPRRLQAGQTIDQISGAIDLFPTLAELTGISYKKAKNMDGVSLAPILNNTSDSWPARNLYSIRKNKVSVRSQDFRLDEKGALFKISEDRAQSVNVAKQYPEILSEMKRAAKSFLNEMQPYQKENAHRPYTVGYAKSTTLTARDGIATGSIVRSSKSANNSFFKNWTSPKDQISWDVDIKRSGVYEVIIYYTCRESDVGSVVRLQQKGGAFTKAKVSESFNPPLYDKSKERMDVSHYFMKDFRPLDLGELHLKKGVSTLLLDAPSIPGEFAIDMISIDLVLK